MHLLVPSFFFLQINSNLRRGKVIRKGKRKKLGIEKKNKRVGLSKRVKENKQEKTKKNIILEYSKCRRKGFEVMSKV